jgi:small-conductance mechanosensitive channel
MLSDIPRPLAWELYGNPLRAWLTAIAVLVGSVVVLLAARRVVIRRLERFAKATRTDFDDLVVDLLRRTRFYFIVLVALAAASLVLDLPGSVRQAVKVFAVLALCLQTITWGNGFIQFWVERYTRRSGADGKTQTTVTAFGYLARFLLWLVVLLLALDNFGINVTALVAGLGVTGVAVALAVQNILGDLLGALSIVVDKPFVVGDAIAVDQFQGTVENIGLKTTRLRSVSGEQIIISNADLLRSRIRNYKRLVERRVAFVTQVDYDTPPETVARIPGMLREFVLAQPLTRFDRSHFRGYGESALEFETVYYMLTDDYNKYMDAQQAINLAMLRRFRVEGIEFAFPTRTIITRVEGAQNGDGGAPILSASSEHTAKD